jgi:hypothetical protein
VVDNCQKFANSLIQKIGTCTLTQNTPYTIATRLGLRPGDSKALLLPAAMMTVLEVLTDLFKVPYPIIPITFQLFQRLSVAIYREFWKHMAPESSIPEELYDLHSLYMRPEPRPGPNEVDGSSLISSC